MNFESKNETSNEKALREVRRIITEIEADYSKDEADDVLKRIVRPQEGFSNLPEAADVFYKRLEKTKIPFESMQVAIQKIYEERLPNNT